GRIPRQDGTATDVPLQPPASGTAPQPGPVVREAPKPRSRWRGPVSPILRDYPLRDGASPMPLRGGRSKSQGRSGSRRTYGHAPAYRASSAGHDPADQLVFEESDVFGFEFTDVVGQTVGEFGGFRREARGVDHDARVGDFRQALQFLGLVPDDVEIGDD